MRRPGAGGARRRRMRGGVRRRAAQTFFHKGSGDALGYLPRMAPK